MSTSAKATQNLPNPVRPQPTPVIIKIDDRGGGSAQGEETPNVTFYSPMTFTDTTGDTWEVAQSTLRGRIVEVTIYDGINFPVDILVTPSDTEPTSVTINFGEETLIVMGEEGALDTTDVLIDVESRQVPFNITAPGLESGWNLSQAFFKGKPTEVVVMQGQRVISTYAVKHPDNVTISPTFHRFPPS